MSEPKISPTADPRVRIAAYGPRNWRTEVQDEPGAAWAITGPPYESKAVALACVDGTVSRHFGEPTWDAVRKLQAQVERLTAQRDELQAKVYAEKRHNGALIADADRRERRALALLPDCEAHRRELQYLRHQVGEYWHAMNDSDEARMAIVSANQLTARSLGDPDAMVKAADVATWLMRNVDKQDKALRRHVFPTQADCLRSAAGECEHEGICDDVKADIAEVLGLVLAAAPARCKAIPARHAKYGR